MILKYKIIYVILLLMMSFGFEADAQHKRALLVGISHYSPDYDWTTLNCTNDIDLIKKSLKGFSITELRDSKATYSSICKQLDLLISKSKQGDIVYLHFSGHGQPVEDYDGDEADGWDESFVAYDAGYKYGEKGYKGEHHLIDDVISQYLLRLRKAVGKTGFVYVVFDACHSGSMQRGDEDNPEVFNDAPIRGTSTGFSKTKIYRPKRDKIQASHYKVPNIDGCADIIIFEACAATQKNQEVKVNGQFYGPLSYSIYSTIKTAGLGRTLSWCNKVEKNMQSLMKQKMSNQTMVTETNLTK